MKFSDFSEAAELNAKLAEIDLDKQLSLFYALSPEQIKELTPRVNQLLQKLADNANQNLAASWNNSPNLQTAVAARYSLPVSEQEINEFLTVAFDEKGKLKSRKELEKTNISSPIFQYAVDNYKIVKDRVLHFFGSPAVPSAVDDTLSEKQRFILDALHFAHVSDIQEQFLADAQWMNLLETYPTFGAIGAHLATIIGDNYKTNHQNEFKALAENINNLTRTKQQIMFAAQQRGNKILRALPRLNSSNLSSFTEAINRLARDLAFLSKENLSPDEISVLQTLVNDIIYATPLKSFLKENKNDDSKSCRQALNGLRVTMNHMVTSYNRKVVPLALPDVVRFFNKMIPAFENKNITYTRQVALHFAHHFLTKEGPFFKNYAPDFFKNKLNALRHGALDVTHSSFDQAFYNQYQQALSLLKMKADGARETFTNEEILQELLNGPAIGLAMGAYFDSKLKQANLSLNELQYVQNRMEQVVTQLADCSAGDCGHKICQSAPDEENRSLNQSTSILNKLTMQMQQVHDDIQVAKNQKPTLFDRFATAIRVKKADEPLKTKHKIIVAGAIAGSVIGAGFLIAGGLGIGVPAGLVIAGGAAAGGLSIAAPIVIRKIGDGLAKIGTGIKNWFTQKPAIAQSDVATTQSSLIIETDIKNKESIIIEECNEQPIIQNLGQSKTVAIPSSGMNSNDQDNSDDRFISINSQNANLLSSDEDLKREKTDIKSTQYSISPRKKSIKKPIIAIEVSNNEKSFSDGKRSPKTESPTSNLFNSFETNYASYFKKVENTDNEEKKDISGSPSIKIGGTKH